MLTPRAVHDVRGVQGECNSASNRASNRGQVFVGENKPRDWLTGSQMRLRPGTGRDVETSSH